MAAMGDMSSSQAAHEFNLVTAQNRAAASLTLRDLEGTALMIDDVIEYVHADHDLFVISRKQDSVKGLIRAHRLDYPMEIYYFRPDAVRLVERRPSFRR